MDLVDATAVRDMMRTLLNCYYFNQNVGVLYSESYQPVAAATELFGFGLLNKIVEDILGPSKRLIEEFGDACKEY